MQHLDGKVAVVTGAASGIGNALARRFAAEGMRVVLADVEAEALARADVALRESGTETLPVVTDVTDADSVEALACATLDRFGGVHVVCNNAGVGGAAGAPCWELADAEWQWVLGVNLFGVLNGMRAFLPRLIAAGEGHMVNTASFAGLRPMPMMAPYSVSKHGVVALTETAFHELAALGSPVRISVLCPSMVATGIADSFRNRPEHLGGTLVVDRSEQETLDALRMFIASGIPPDDVAEAVLDAIRAERFWILTHDDTRRSIRERGAAIAEGRDPVAGL